MTRLVLTMIIFSVLVYNFIGAALGLPQKVPIGRITGGQGTDISNYPYALQLFYLGKLQCGGILISNKHAITAAHCLHDTYTEYFEIRAGTTYLEEGGQTFTIAKTTTHPKFTWDTNYYDAVILHLSDAVKVGSAQPAQLATHDGLITAGSTVFVAGWGWVVRNNKDEPSPTLQDADLTVLDDAICKHFYDGANIKDATFCANYTGKVKDFCFGDYGGPAVSNGIVQGIISFGDSCGDGHSVKAFVRMSKIVSWVQSVINQ